MNASMHSDRTVTERRHRRWEELIAKIIGASPWGQDPPLGINEGARRTERHRHFEELRPEACHSQDSVG